MASNIRLVALALLGLSAFSMAKPIVYGGAADPECPVIPESCSAAVAASLCGPTTVTSFVSTVTNIHTITQDLSPSAMGPSTVTVTVTATPTQANISTVPISETPIQSISGSITSTGFVSPTGTAPSPIIDTIIPSSPSVNTITLTITESGTVLIRTHTVTNAQPSTSAAISTVSSLAETSLPIFTITRVITESGIAHTITHTQTRSPLPVASASDIGSVHSSASPIADTSNSVVTVTMTFGEGTVRTFTQTMTNSPPFPTVLPINTTATSCPAPSVIVQTVTETVTGLVTATLDISTDFNGNTLTRTHTFTNSPINVVTDLNSNTPTRTHTLTNSPVSAASSLSTMPSPVSINRLTTRILIPGPAMQTASPMSTWESTVSAAHAASTPCDDEKMWTTDATWKADPTIVAASKWAGNENGDWNDKDGSWDAKDGDWDGKHGDWDAKDGHRDAEHTGAWDEKDGSWGNGNGDGEWDGEWNGEPTGLNNGHWKREEWTGKAKTPAAKEIPVMKETTTKKWNGYGYGW